MLQQWENGNLKHNYAKIAVIFRAEDNDLMQQIKEALKIDWDCQGSEGED